MSGHYCKTQPTVPRSHSGTGPLDKRWLKGNMRASLGKRQRGSSIVEYMVVAAALIALWIGSTVFMQALSEHSDEFTTSIAQPF